MNSDLKFYLALALKRLPLLLSLLVATTAVGVALALTLPPTYSAKARLLVENAQIATSMVESTVQTTADKQLQIIEERLVTRANMIDAANKYDVFPEGGKMLPDDIFEAMVRRTQIKVTDGNDRRVTLMEITFEADDPRTAANIVNEFVTLVESESAEISRGEATQTAEFFEAEVKRLSEALSIKSSEIVAFKEANKDALPEEQSYRMDRQNQIQERVSVNSRDLVSLREQRNRLLAVGTGMGADQPLLSPKQQQLAGLQSELNNALSVYSESNPRVKLIRAQIERLESSMVTGDSAAQDLDPMQTILDLQLADIDSRIAYLEEDIAKSEAEIARLREAIEKTPENGILLEALTRDYENVQGQYNRSVASLATAKIGESIEVQGKGERVSVIERAVPPSNPSGPNRKLIAGGGVFAGGALATLLFVLLELMNRTIRRPIDLARGLGVQPLVTIPYIEHEAVSNRRRIAYTILIFGAVVSALVAIWAVHVYYLPLDLLLERGMKTLGL